MKRTDIQEGVVYAYSTSKQGGADKVAVLDPGNLYQVGAPRRAGGFHSDKSLVTVLPSMRSQTVRDNVGLLGVIPPWGKPQEDLSQRLLQATTELALASHNLTIDALSVQLAPLNPRYILSTWEEYEEQERQEAARRQEGAQRLAETRARKRREMTDRVEMLNRIPNLGEVQANEARGTITLTLAQIDILLK